ncbi:uncharacterized protein LOC131845698 [Achroia grisella]|uniref:uncharacterized protein LOC131845698 n=1 Tax=Achroia grisella TaxID=688607 RepID=UPI0027D276BC|nr:uncharacterized protein LOC131845698 [Achroia grisella]
MDTLLRAVLIVFCFKYAAFSDSPCTIELECRECIPDNMPLVTSHRSENGTITAAAGDEVVLVCSGGKFLAYPLRDTLTVVCKQGRYRVPHDGSLKHLIELGCQENVFEDVLHEVAGCAPPLQGRAYQGAGGGRVAHVAALCYDADRGLLRHAHLTAARGNDLRLPPHSHHTAPLTLLGNFNHMFDAKNRQDAEMLYSDDARLNRRLHELLKHEPHTFADQTLTAVKLLSPHYFEDQNMRVTDFASNKAAVWRSVAAGNLLHLQRDVARAIRLTHSRAVAVVTGTQGVAEMRTGHHQTRLFLKAGERFPVPKYIWMVVVDYSRRRALAVVVLNDPFVAVSEIKEAVFCDSACNAVNWIHELKKNRNYETPVYGLAFCCSLQNFTKVVTDVPSDLRMNISDFGVLTDLTSDE